MAKCYSCGKNFDYEKYYGICPKCGIYNAENTPEDEYKEPIVSQDSNPPTSYPYSGVVANTTEKASSTGTIVFILLLVGIIGAIAVPCIYAAVRVHDYGRGVVAGIANMIEKKWEDAEDLEEIEIKLPETTNITTGEPCYLGIDQGMEIIVKEARVITPANYVEDFPKNQKLVAVSVSYQCESTAFLSREHIYVGFDDNIYKQMVEGYAFEDYEALIGNIIPMNSYDLLSGTGEGLICFFVPEDITTLDFYIESVNEDSYSILDIYCIPLEIQEGLEG